MPLQHDIPYSLYNKECTISIPRKRSRWQSKFCMENSANNYVLARDSLASETDNHAPTHILNKHTSSCYITPVSLLSVHLAHTLWCMNNIAHINKHARCYAELVNIMIEIIISIKLFRLGNSVTHIHNFIFVPPILGPFGL